MQADRLCRLLLLRALPWELPVVEPPACSCWTPCQSAGWVLGAVAARSVRTTTAAACTPPVEEPCCSRPGPEAPQLLLAARLLAAAPLPPVEPKAEAAQEPLSSCGAYLWAAGARGRAA
jgi:hypothetical protein